MLQLKDKSLGCFCKDTKFCHGHVLIELLEEFLQEQKRKFQNVCGNIVKEDEKAYFFHGDSQPLSNLYKTSIVNKNGVVFENAFQMLTYRKALYYGKTFIAQQILKSRRKRIGKLSTLCNNSELDRSSSCEPWSTVQELFFVLKEKSLQSDDFHQV